MVSVLKEIFLIKGKCGCYTESLGAFRFICALYFTASRTESFYFMGRVLLLYKVCKLWSALHIVTHILEMPPYFHSFLYVVISVVE